jgi:hypothetical protein
MGKIFLHKSLDEIVARLVADMRHFGAPKHSGCSLTQSHHSDIHAEPRQFCMQRKRSTEPLYPASLVSL